MNSQLEKLIPFSGNHSIKEAVISIFLLNDIIKPERFQKLIQSKDFQESFKKFEPLESFQLQIKNEAGASSVNYNALKNSGFRFSGFDNAGKTVKVFQGSNEDNRRFISYHDLNYSSWKNFNADYLKIINHLISDFNEPFLVDSFSLHYIDVFNWKAGINEFPKEEIFNRNGKILPLKFFESEFDTTFLLTIEQIIENVKFLDRIQIKIENKILPEITISHNISYKLINEEELSSLINKPEFYNTLSLAHGNNKKVLSEILTKEVQELIKLKF